MTLVFYSICEVCHSVGFCLVVLLVIDAINKGVPMTSFNEREERIRKIRLTMRDIRFLLYSGKVSKRNLKAYYLSEFEGESNGDIAETLGVSKARVHQMIRSVKVKALMHIKDTNECKSSSCNKLEYELFDIQYSSELHKIAKHLSLTTKGQ